MGGSKEQILGVFCHKLWDYACEKKITESYISWQNVFELKSKEFKKISSRKLPQINTPTRFGKIVLSRKHMYT